MAVLAIAVTPRPVHAVARPHHAHEDIFAEEDLLIGFKLGPQVTSFTDYKSGNATIGVQPNMRFIGGATFKFIYAVPRIEVGFLWNARGWVNTAETVNYLALPVLLKLPLEVDKDIDFEIGAGVEPEVIIFGVDPHRNTMMGILGSVGLSVDFTTFVFDFEIRYNVGTSPVSDFYSGAKNRDLQPIAGVLWHF